MIQDPAQVQARWLLDGAAIGTCLALVTAEARAHHGAGAVMDDRHYKKRLVAVVIVLSAVMVAGGLFVTFSSFGRDLIGGPGSIMGWAVPLAGLFVITAITWLLILGDSHVHDDQARYVPCWSCGHSVMHEWRLCPFCGAELRAWSSAAEESLRHG
jgi:hypothetical protein